MNREQCAIHKVDIAIADKPRDAFRRQSRSPIWNHYMLGMVFCYCSIATLSLGRTVFETFDVKNAVILKT